MTAASVSARLGFANAMFYDRARGAALPRCDFGELVGDTIEHIRSEDIFTGMRAIVLGVPGAFTPVCTTRHLPEYIANADALRALGYDRLVCVVPNDPWTVHRWAGELDPGGCIRFLSDGNLAFVRALGLSTHVEAVFLGECSKRYLMTVADGVIERLKVEREVTDLSCTLTSTLLVD